MYRLFYTIAAVFVLTFCLAHTADAAISRAPNNLGLTAYWSFNEGTSTNAIDRSGAGNHAWLVNSPAWIDGKYGKALSFDGVNDTVFSTKSVGNITPFTISLWFKTTSANGKKIIGLEDQQTGQSSASYDRHMYINADGKLLFGVYNTSARIATSTAAVNDGRWHHAVGVSNGSTVVLYIDGVFQSQTNGSAYTGYTNSYWRIGGYKLGTWTGGSDGYFSGSIDETRIYNRALSATEVAALYGSGAARMGVSRTDILNDGLIGHWTMDGKDINWTTSKIADRSGRGYSATLGNVSAATNIAPGKIGQAIKFWNTSNNIVVSNMTAADNMTNFTYSAWVKLNACSGSCDGQMIMDKEQKVYLVTATCGFACSGIRAHVTHDTTSAVKVTNEIRTTISNKWAHVTMTYDGTTKIVKLYVNGVEHGGVGYATNTTGSGTRTSDASPVAGRLVYGQNIYGNSRMYGLLDDARVYNRVLSDAEVKQLYDSGAGVKQGVSSVDDLTSGLVGHWTFDGKHTSWATHKTNDQSGNGYHATLKNMSTSTGTGFGKIGQAVALDGVNDYVDAGTVSVDLESDYTAAVWVKSAGPSASEKVALGIGHPSISTRLTLGFYTTGHPRILLRQDGNANVVNLFNSGPIIADGKWHHFAFVFKPSVGTLDVYIDGAAIISDGSYSAYTSISANYVTFGASNIAGSVGSISNVGVDDARIYNRILTASEVKQLYNMGK